jgi:hypothetical protein
MKLKLALITFTVMTAINSFYPQKANAIGSSLSENMKDIKNNKDSVLNKMNLDDIKHKILQSGQTCTWSNMYNNNPCFETINYQFYLNPDPGGPHNHIQWNINCDPKKGDFNTLVIVQKQNTKTTANNNRDNLIDTKINFVDGKNIRIMPYSVQATFLSAGAIESSEIALTELLQAVKKPKKIAYKSPLSALVIKVGMTRLEIETMVSKVMNAELNYNTHNGGSITNEEGLKASYSDGVIEITVQYATGARV